MALMYEKMDGLGNDFVILDARTQTVQLTEEQIQATADREMGVGCDQLIVMEEPTDTQADLFMRIYNADGSEVGACGNATRCVAWLEMQASDKTQITVQTAADLLHCEKKGRLVAVNMGMPKLDWQDIPVRETCDTLHLPLVMPPLSNGVGVNIGNPHAVYFVNTLEGLDFAALGVKLEVHPFFPERANISIAKVEGKHCIHLRVWERGAGLTQACGTAACAAMVAARRRGLVDKQASVRLPGGVLEMRWDGREDDPHHPVWMTGPVQHHGKAGLTLA